MDGRFAAAATLGVPVDATKSEIRRAFRALVKRVHPDVARHAHQSDAGAFLRLRHAFDTLMVDAPDDVLRPAPPQPRFFSGWSVDPKAASRIDMIDEPRYRIAGQTSEESKASTSPNGKLFAEHLAQALAAA